MNQCDANADARLCPSLLNQNLYAGNSLDQIFIEGKLRRSYRENVRVTGARTVRTAPTQPNSAYSYTHCRETTGNTGRIIPSPVPPIARSASCARLAMPATPPA